MHKQISRKIYFAILILCIISLIFSIVVELQKKNNETIGNICKVIDGGNSCQTVQQSKYSQTFGIDNPYFGMVGFSILIIICSIQLIKSNHRASKHFDYILLIGPIISGLVALYFIYLQIFVIRAFCVYCLVVDACSIALFIMLLSLIIKK